MDSNGVNGDVLVCNSSTSFISPICLTDPCTSATSTLGEVSGIEAQDKKPKKRRYRQRQKKKLIGADSQEEPSGLSSITSNLSVKFVEDMAVFMSLANDVQVPDTDETQKPKKVRKRKKSQKNKIEGDTLQETLNLIQSLQDQLLINNTVENVETPIKLPEKQPKCQTIQHKPFFVDNQKGARKGKCSSKKKPLSDEFEEYLSIDEVEQGIKDKTMVVGPIRINQRCYKEAYITSEGNEKDIMIEGVKNRNRALEGDEVVILLNPPEAWKPTGQRTGKVVYILDKFHARTCVGKLPSVLEPNNKYIVFSPRDPRVPRMKMTVRDSCIPSMYLTAPQLYCEMLFLAKITAWTDVNFAEGVIISEVGMSGDVEGETQAIMQENNLDPNPLDPTLRIFFPSLPYCIPEDEIAKRLDLRKECIFTIDPATARDLDDAVSAKHLPNGNIEVGVHISDVSFFLENNTLLDHIVSRRATTVYLVQRVYHMLPVDLCQLCSLTPMEDKLAFSVFVELTPDAQVVSHRFARTVINCCTKLAYEHAQIVIDNPDKVFTSEDFPEIGNGFGVENCVATIKELFELSKILRKRRFDSGALRIDQPKLCFNLDPNTQAPIGSFIYENKESHRLIEEFMLLANMTVAKHIYDVYPNLAFLRRHVPPKINMLVELQKKFEQCGIHLDISNAGTVHSSILKYSSTLEGESPLLSWARYIVLNNLCAKPMQRANYFCPSVDDPELHHYALNASHYTHFTSPIRRYADVMVHRLLAASLGLAPLPSWTPENVRKIARICNQQKQAAKLAGEQSSLLFLALFLQEPVESDAAIIDVKDRSMDVVVKVFGVVLRVYTDPLPVKVVFSNENEMQQLHIHWTEENIDQFVQLFSVVRVSVTRAKEGLKLSATLLPPLPETSDDKVSLNTSCDGCNVQQN